MDVTTGPGRPLLRMAGLTLVELLTAVSLAGILAAVGLPQFSSTLERMRVQTTVHRLTADMASARMRAVTRRAQVVLCPRSLDASRCGDSRDWTNGWIVFDDPEGRRQPDGAADILRSMEPVRGNLRIGATREFLRYQADGRSAHSNLSVNVCAGDRLVGRVIVNNLGRVRSERLDGALACPGR